MEEWIQLEIKRKLDTDEAHNTIYEPLDVSIKEELTIYEYSIKSKIESETILITTIFYDGKRKYEFRTQIPEMTEGEYRDIIESFKINKKH